ncbi:MAG: hypothetical protein ACRDNJ_05805 [Solirubrobacteraceae bacterium]
MLITAVGALALVAASTASAIPLVTGHGVRVRVSPHTGHPRTTFRFRLRLPSQLPAMISWARRDTLSVIGPHRAGCVAATTVALPTDSPGAAVNVRLNPARLGEDGRWCIGRFHGTVVDTERVICSPPPVYIMCPDIMIAPQVIARFTFRVTRTA